MNYISSLEELYNHPANGASNAFLAAFLSSDGTYPIFITKVTRNDSGQYTAAGIGYKWGYSSPDTMRETFWSDDHLQRNVSRQFFHWYEVSEHRFAPGVSAPMPIATQAKCHFLPFLMHRITYQKSPGGEDSWVYVAVASAISEHHAQWLLENESDDDLCNIGVEPLNRPHIMLDVWED